MRHECRVCHQFFPHRDDCRLIECNHGVTFDSKLAISERLSPQEVRRRWPRLDGECPEGCGYEGVYYASIDHYVRGDWDGDIPTDIEAGPDDND